MFYNGYEPACPWTARGWAVADHLQSAKFVERGPGAAKGVMGKEKQSVENESATR